MDDVRAAIGQMVADGKSDVAIDSLLNVVDALKRENRVLSLERIRLLKRIYGRTKERIDSNQLALLFGDMRKEQAATQASESDPHEDVPNDPPDTNPNPKPKGGKRPSRKPLPPDLPRTEVRLFPTSDQLEGKEGMRKLSEQRSEVLEYEPGKFRVVVYVRETWSNGKGDIVTAPAPAKVIEKGIAGPGLLAHITVSKFVDHLPLHRQTRIFLRDGIRLHRSRLVEWMAAVAYLLQPLAKLIHRAAMNAHVLQVDDTPLKVQDRSKPRNIKRGHLWVLVGDGEYVSVRYTEDWTQAKAEAFLGERIGWMQVDGYGGYEPVGKDRPILLVGCFMHARRYFVEALEAKDLRAAEPVELIRRMYAVERASKEANESHPQRHERRQRDLVPLLDELEKWLRKNKGIDPPNEPLGRAMTYLDNHWKILRVVEKDGALELDNGEPERRIRGPAMGRRNWLFAGSDAGAENAATILTVLETAKSFGVDPREYLKDVLTKIAGGWKQSRLGELMPDAWAKTRPQLSV